FLMRHLCIWLAIGVPVLTNAGPALSDSGRTHWAFQSIRSINPSPPARSSWVRTPVDHFILAKLRERQLEPAAPADRSVLIRRVTFDLTGLPPTPEDVDEFVHDQRPDAYACLVERLLASPRYGERWAQHWLDVARYAETDGYEADGDRPFAWRYRDYI